MNVKIIKATLVAVILMGGLLCFALVGLDINNCHDEEIGENTSIFSLYDTNSVSGSFLVGCGQLHGEMRYTLYIEAEDNDGIKMKQIPVDNTIIYEDTKCSPYLTEYNLYKVRTSSGEIIGQYHSKRRYPYYELHVPLGTIIQQYSLDGK